MIQQILVYSFYLLFALTPLVWTPWNHELFEYNKMMFVYLLTVIIAISWIIKMIQQKRLIIKRTVLDIPLLIFLAANILSTIFSVDSHTSVWGYYSRSNGGLLSLISYLLLYFALVANFKAPQAIKFLKATLVGGVVVSLWAIFEHFGVSLSCILISGQANASCWVQDVQARVFATLGQPNWLAAYLGMIIFPAFYFAITSPYKLRYALYATVFYLAFTFTYSRGATLGFLAGLIVFILSLLISYFKSQTLSLKLLKSNPLLKILGLFIFINIIFGSSLTSFKLLSKFAPPPRPSLVSQTSSTTQMESGGTESGQIRLIVWRGALEIFKHYPILGSGVETFAYTYYYFRPVEHNLVSEWDFLYNKAHNEYLNYLATTGLVGFLSYIFIILTFITWSLAKIFNLKFKVFNQFLNVLNPEDKTITSNYLLPITILAAYFSYLVQNFFGFSVVIIALYFFLFPALLFVATDSVSEFLLPKQLFSIRSTLRSLFYRNALYLKILTGIVLIFGLFFTLSLVKFWWADTLFATGSGADESGNPGQAYNLIAQATELNPGESFYRSELGFVAAQTAVALEAQDSSLSAQLRKQAILQTNNILQNHPANVSYFRTAVRTYYMLSALDTGFIKDTLDTMDQAIGLAPTDPKLLYNKAIILSQEQRNQEAIIELEKAIKLKPNYIEAIEKLKELEK